MKSFITSGPDKACHLPADNSHEISILFIHKKSERYEKICFFAALMICSLMFKGLYFGL